MKKGTILRNEAPHAVNMPEGSKVAARKVKKEPTSVQAPQEVPPPQVNRKSLSPKTKMVKDKPAPVKVAVKPRAKASAAKAPTQELASTSPALATRILPPPIDEAAIWEKDNPVKNRMTQLKARNALLEEQLQRLQSPFQARGRKP